MEVEVNAGADPQRFDAGEGSGRGGTGGGCRLEYDCCLTEEQRMERAFEERRRDTEKWEENYDLELSTMRDCWNKIYSLSNDVRVRVVRYLTDRVTGEVK